MAEEIRIPDIGEKVEAGKVVAVHIQVGDRIDVDDTLIELETDKAVVEIPSTVKGKVVEVLAREGGEMRVGDVIARVEADGRKGAGDAAAAVEGAGASEEKSSGDEDEEPVEEASARVEKSSEGKNVSEETPKSESPPESGKRGEVAAGSGKERRPRAPAAASPSMRRLARELGVDLAAIAGSGPGGRITEADIKSQVRQARRQDAAPGEPELPDFGRWGEVESRELETVRRLTARSTAASWHAVPHVTQFDNADITDLNRFLEKNRQAVADAGGKLTLTAVLTRVCAAALKKYPRFNASIDLRQGRLILKKYVHISMAVDTPRGLLMPVIRDADRKSITRLAVEIRDLAGRAREKKVKPEELEGGTFSISNQGGIGGVGFTPIVLWPQAAILGISRAAVEPRHIDGGFQPRTILPLSLSYDHRIVDGADAARFLRWICDSLEQPMTLLL